MLEFHPTFLCLLLSGHFHTVIAFFLELKVIFLLCGNLDTSLTDVLYLLIVYFLS